MTKYKVPIRLTLYRKTLDNAEIQPTRTFSSESPIPSQTVIEASQTFVISLDSN